MRKFLPSGPRREGMVSGGEAGVPSVRTIWQPTPRVGLQEAMATASSKRRACGHEGGGGEDACLVEFEDGTIDARGEAEVVSVDDEAGRH